MNAAREMTLDEWMDRLPPNHRANKELATLRAEMAEAKADGERLDWLEAHGKDVKRLKWSGGRWFLMLPPPDYKTGATLRAAIDSARKGASNG